MFADFCRYKQAAGYFAGQSEGTFGQYSNPGSERNEWHCFSCYHMFRLWHSGSNIWRQCAI